MSWYVSVHHEAVYVSFCVISLSFGSHEPNSIMLSMYCAEDNTVTMQPV